MSAKVGSLLLAAVLMSALVGCTTSSRRHAPPALTSITVSAGGSSVLVGSSTPAFVATGHFDDGSMQTLTSGVTWASSDPTKATINSSGIATGVFHGSTDITASKGSATSAPTALDVIAILESMVVTPLGPAIVVDNSQQFAATGSFNDGSVSDVTSSASWSSNGAAATIDPASGLATGQAAGTVTITAAATAADGTPVAATTALNVVSSAYVQLNGSYAFTLFSADTRGTAFAFGSLHVDGSGAIDSGAEDCNNVNGVNQDEPVTGTYFEYPDGRGQISIAANPCHPAGITLRYILAAGGNTGRLAQFDGLGTAKGILEPQTSTTAFGAASYVFRVAGSDSSSEPMGAVGQFTADGDGNITNGTIDINDFGTSIALVPLSASTYTAVPDANGRGIGQLSYPNIGNGSTNTFINFTFYAVNSNKINFIQTDTGSASAVAGVAEVQNIPEILDDSALKGTYSFLVGRPVIVNTTGFDRTEFAQVGEYTFDGVVPPPPSSLTGVRDDTDNPVPNPLVDITGNYTFIGGVPGRATFDANSPSQGTDRLYTCYAVSALKSGTVDRAFVLMTGVAKNAPTGEMDLQTAISSSALSGVYALDASELTASYSEALMAITVDGDGNASGIADVSAPVNGTLTLSSGEVAGASYGDSPNAGRAILSLPNQVGFQDSIFYLISPQSAWVLGITPDTPAADGTLTQQ